MKVRKAKASDASQLVEVMKDAEASGFMLFDPGERTLTVAQFEQYIEATNQKQNSAVFVATKEEQILGYMIVQGETQKRIAHRAYIVIGVHSASRGKGVGTALFTHAEQWAKEADIQRLELTVIKHNEAAYHLYKKMGFQVEGVKQKSLKMNGEYVDQYYMAKMI